MPFPFPPPASSGIPAIVSPRPALDALLAGQVWRADALAGGPVQVLSTGLPALDAVLPGGGWPVGALVEVLQAQAHQHVWRLLAPALARAVEQQAGPVVMVGPPHPAFVPGLAARGLPAHRLLWVQADLPAARLWAAEQALRCAQVAAVLAWLPQAPSADLRRLHLTAQRHGQLLFVMRPEAVRAQASPARLRLLLEAGEALRVQVLKRRGPPLAASVCLPQQPAVLAALLQAHAPAVPSPLVPWQTALPGRPASPRSPARIGPDHPHGLDRITAPA